MSPTRTVSLLAYAAALLVLVGVALVPRERCVPEVRSPEPGAPESGASLDEAFFDDADRELASTYSIVARDPENGDLGVAVQSKYFSVGIVVPWVEAGVGAIATQSYANATYGPRGLELLRQGRSAAETLAALLESDPGRERRQVGIVDAAGRAANHTGSGCHHWAGARHGEGYTVQGNILVGAETVDAMARAFEESRGEELAERLMRALEAGQAAGGDIRGRQSACIHVVRKGGREAGGGDRRVWLHVEDHPQPVRELRRLLELRFGRDPLTRARRARRTDRIDEARRLVEEAERAAPGDPEGPLERAAVELAALEAGSGDEAAARKAFREAIDRAIALDPGYDCLHYRAAFLHLAAGEPDHALERLERLLELNPRYRPRLEWEMQQEGSPLAPLKDRLK